MKTTRIILTALALLALLSRGALCQVWQEERITTGHTWFTGSVKLWQDTMYWTDWRSGGAEVYTYDPIGGERHLIGDGSGDSTTGYAAGAVYGDKLAVLHYINAQYDLYLWDPIRGLTAISTAPGDQKKVEMSDKLLTWEDYRSGTPQVYVYDPVNGERPIHPTSSSQTNPRVWGDQVVYEDDRNGRSDIYLWNPRDGETKLSTYIYGMVSPAIYGDRVVMWLVGGSYPEDRGLWEWTPDHGLRQLAQKNYTSPYGAMHTRTWGDLVVYQSGIGPSGVGAWGPVHGFTAVNQSAPGAAMSPSVFQNKVAWVGNYDIYLSTLVPEPSGLATLGLLACGLWPIVRRRRRAWSNTRSWEVMRLK